MELELTAISNEAIESATSTEPTPNLETAWVEDLSHPTQGFGIPSHVELFRRTQIKPAGQSHAYAIPTQIADGDVLFSLLQRVKAAA